MTTNPHGLSEGREEGEEGEGETARESDGQSGR